MSEVWFIAGASTASELQINGRFVLENPQESLSSTPTAARKHCEFSKTSIKAKLKNAVGKDFYDVFCPPRIYPLLHFYCTDL
jgi:hypothetical protein